MSIVSNIDQVSDYLYKYFVGFDQNKVKSLQDAFNKEDISGDSSIDEDYKLIESYYVDKEKSNKINDKVLEVLIKDLKNCIEIKKKFSIPAETNRRYPLESRFFFRVYHRKFDEISKQILKTNPFDFNTDDYRTWENSVSINNTPPVFEEFRVQYDNWKISVMKDTHTYLDSALEGDLKNRIINNGLLPLFTYCIDKENEIKKKILLRVINRIALVAGFLYGLRALIKPNNKI